MLTEIDTNTTQLFDGARLSQDQRECTACNRILREGEQIAIYAAREEDPHLPHRASVLDVGGE